jgi:hypothetical protein
VQNYERHMRGARIETLQHALKLAGGEEDLAEWLHAEPQRLRRWLAALEPVPLDTFLEALDFLARGPYGPERKSRGRRPVVLAVPPTGA